jgi:hypothetical protein
MPSLSVKDRGAANAPGSALPRDKASLNLDYTLGNLNVDVQERYYSPIRQNANPKLVFDIPSVPAYFVTDFNIAYDFDAWQVPFTGFLHIDNVFDRDPDVLQVPGYTGSPGMNYPVVPYEDLIGRYYTVGVRFKM